MHYQCSHEKISTEPSNTKRWCCASSDCDEHFEWGYCPESKHPLNHDCSKDGYSSIDSGRNCYKHFVNEVILLY